MADLEALRRRRSGIKAWITQGRNQLSKLSKEVPLPQSKLLSQLTSLQERQGNLRIVQQEIEALLDDEAAILAEVDAQAQFDEECADDICKYRDLLNLTRSSPPSGSTVDSTADAKSGYKLPRVELPTFSGAQTEWIPFIQSFKNAVDKLKIPDYMKLTILRQYVAKDAEAVIQWYSLSDENYSPAMKALEKKYGNHLKLIDAYVDLLVELILNLSTKSNSMTLRQIYDRLHSAVQILETLDVNRENYAVLLVPMMRNCLPAETKKEWAKYEILHNPSIRENPDPSTSPSTLPNRLTLFLEFLLQEVEIKDLTDTMSQGSLSKTPKQDKKEKEISMKKDKSWNNGQNGNKSAEVPQSTGSFMSMQPNPGYSSQSPQQPYRPPSNQGQGKKKKSGSGDAGRPMRAQNPQTFQPTSQQLPPSKVMCPPCPFCFIHHHPARCWRAESLSPADVLAFIRRDFRCETCLGYHPNEVCRTRRPCMICSGLHHPLICAHRSITPSPRADIVGMPISSQSSYQPRPHVPTSSQPPTRQQTYTTTMNTPTFQPPPPATTQGVQPGVPDPSVQGMGQVFSGNFFTGSQHQSSILQTATVTAVNPTEDQSGRSLTVRVLLDLGSQRSYVTTDTVQGLKMAPVRHEFIATSSFGGQTSTPALTPVVTLRLNSRYLDLGGVTVDAFVVPIISNCSLPVANGVLKPGTFSLPLADSREFERLPISVLIGADYYWDIFGNDIKPLSNSPSCNIVGMNSVFGYVLSGRTDSPSLTVNCNMVITRPPKEVDPDPVLEQFWKLESLGICDDEISTKDDELAQRIFEENISFDGTRYVVGLTWKPNHPPLQSNYMSARARFMKLLSNLQTNPVLEQAYDASLSEFVEEGYVERAPPAPQVDAHAEFYLPHHPVVKPGSSTYKVRPVMDASAKDPSGLALNDCLMIGPSLLPDLFVTLMRFRLEPVAFIGDIRRAFLRIGIKDRDRDALRLITKNGIMRFTRVPFGTSCSPFLLNATIRYHLKTRETPNEFESDVEKDLDSRLYVDDYASGSTTDSLALQKITTAIKILAEADMELRSWSSNSAEVMESLKIQGIHIEPDTSPFVLGVKWDTVSDTLSTRQIEWKFDAVTKRTILSFIAQVYDVLGLFSPITIRGKILLQTLFRKGVGWDDVVQDSDLLSEFSIVRADLQALSTLTIPRCVAPTPTKNIHLICDASKDAYTGAVYVVTSESSNLLVSKARVAPLKPSTTVPRLELLACYIGAKLLSKLLSVPWGRSDVTVTCWTDSSIALAWLKYPERINSRAVFVSNRVRKILKLTENIEWRYIPTELNTADLATRSNQTLETLMQSRWFSGPEFITKPRDEWPETGPLDTEHMNDFTGVAMVTKTSTNKIQAIFELKTHSKLSKALNITVYVLRFITKCISKSSSTRQPQGQHRVNLEQLQVGHSEIETESGETVYGPSPSEIQRALLYWIIVAQSEHYSEEFLALQSNMKISVDSDILDLKPYLDEDGVMRSLGRCHRAAGYPAPIILQAKHQLTVLIIAQTHGRLCHAGVTTTLTEIRLRYWIVRGRRTVKSVLNNCLICRRFRVKPYLQIEPALPEFRLSPAKPFLMSGCDFAGPLYIKGGTAYILLFTCCNVRAIHLEVTPDKSTTSVLQAFSRFVDRRGACNFMISDNDKAFLKARQSLPEVKWVTIPERSLWWGGFYERLVRSFKTPMKRVLGKSTLQYEELRTLAPHIEAAVNRRPITYLSDDVRDPMPLRPVDFLLCPGPPEMTGPSLSYPTRWRHRIATYQSLYARWKKEYLAELHRWSKARTEGEATPKVGDVVMVDPLNVSNRALFPLGRILTLIPGRDGHSRAAMVQLANNKTVRRSTKLLYPLETDGIEPTPIREKSADPADTQTPVLYRTRSGRVVKTARLHPI